jgi:uncharacterized protein (DUF433 family)
MIVRKAIYPHIGANPRIANGAAIIKGTRITVRAIAGYYQLGMAVDEILQSLPHLSQSQVHSALAFYFDHQKQIDKEWKRNSDIDFWQKRVKQIAPPARKPNQTPSIA